MNRPSRRKLQSRTNTFSGKTIDLLFSHIMANDVVAHNSALPDRVPVIFSDQDIHSAYCLARELFIRRLDIGLLYTLVLNIAVTGDLEVVEQRAFKDARARFKQIRFAHANFDYRHRYPLILNLVTTALGHLQDDFRNRRPVKARAQAILTGCLLMPPLSCMIQRELNNFQTCSQTELMEWIGVENRHLCNFAQSRHLTGKDFHDARKIISRRVSLYDTLRVIRPSPDLDQVSRFLSTLNGMMGKFHDRLVADRAHGLRHYRTETFPFPSEIQEKLIWFIHQSSM